MVAGGIVYRRNVHQLVHQVEHDMVIGVRVDVHIARHRDEVRGKVLYLPHKVGVVFAVLVEMQVGQQNDAQVFYRLIHRDRIKRRDEALIHLQIVQQDAAQHKHDGQQPCQNFLLIFPINHSQLSLFSGDDSAAFLAFSAS